MRVEGNTAAASEPRQDEPAGGDAMLAGSGPQTGEDMQPEAYGPSAAFAEAGPPAGVEAEPLDPERQREIDGWLDDNATASSRFLGIGPTNRQGGDRVGDALQGESELGELNAAETTYLAEQAVSRWTGTGTDHREDIREAAEAVVGHPQARTALAAAYVAPVVRTERAIAEAGAIFTTEEAMRTEAALLEHAVDLDPAGTIDAFTGVEGALGRRVSNMSRERQTGLLRAVADGRVDPVAADPVVSAIFVQAEGRDLGDDAFASALAGALAQTYETDTGIIADARRDAIEGRLSAAFDDGDVRGMLTNESVLPELRGWALANIAEMEGWTPEALSDGWESDIVSEAVADPVMAQYAARGTDPQVLSGNALRNVVGQALSLPPDRLPAAGETAAEREARLAAGLDHAYYGPNDRLDAADTGVVTQIERYGGTNARVSVMPVTVTSNEFGAATFTVFRVEGTDGRTHFIDDQGLHYDSFAEWRSENRLPPGRMTYQDNMDWAGGETVTENTPGVVDSFGEWAGQVGDTVALGAGIVAGAAIIVGSGGTAAPLVAGAAGLYTAARAGQSLASDADRGIDILDLSDPAVRSNWLDVAAGTLSLGAIGAGVRATQLAGRGVQLSTGASRAIAGLQIAANTADAAAAGNQAVILAQNWGDLSTGDRAAGLLNLAFLGGMTAASTRAGGAVLQDAFSFSRLSNQIEFGSPYRVETNPALANGQARVAYDGIGPDGRLTGLRIETGGAVDAEVLALHTRVARQMDAGGGLEANLRTLIGGEGGAPVGSAAWEAQLEIGKIRAEADGIARQLANPNVTETRRATLESRLDELAIATDVELARLDMFAGAGRGWVASPETGSEQARRLGWADAPEGYRWVAGASEPHLLASDGSLPDYWFDPNEGIFTNLLNRGRERNLNRIAMSPEPNARYEFRADQPQVFFTNAEGNVRRVEAGLTLDDAWVRDLRSQADIGNLGTPPESFDGGHLIARLFGGGPDRINVVPQDSYLNRHGQWRQLERSWEGLLRSGQEVEVEIDVVYPPGGGDVPQRFEVTTYVDGMEQPTQEIWNTRTGERPDQ